LICRTNSRLGDSSKGCRCQLDTNLSLVRFWTSIGFTVLPTSCGQYSYTPGFCMHGYKEQALLSVIRALLDKQGCGRSGVRFGLTRFFVALPSIHRKPFTAFHFTMTTDLRLRDHTSFHSRGKWMSTKSPPRYFGPHHLLSCSFCAFENQITILILNCISSNCYASSSLHS
jgi:hypothetical protein